MCPSLIKPGIQAIYRKYHKDRNIKACRCWLCSLIIINQLRHEVRNTDLYNNVGHKTLSKGDHSQNFIINSDKLVKLRRRFWFVFTKHPNIFGLGISQRINKRKNSRLVCSFVSKYNAHFSLQSIVWAIGEESKCEHRCPLGKRENNTWNQGAQRWLKSANIWLIHQTCVEQVQHKHAETWCHWPLLTVTCYLS